MPSQNKTSNEADISAIQKEKKEQTWFQGKDVFSQWSQHHLEQAEKGTQEIIGFRRTEAQSLTSIESYS